MMTNTFGRLATQPLPSALLVARTNPGPRGDVFLRSKARHIGPNFCQDAGRCRLINPSHALHSFQSLLKRVQVVFHFRLKLGQGFFQKVDRRQKAREQHAVMRLHPSIQREALVRQFGPQASSCQLG